MPVESKGKFSSAEDISGALQQSRATKTMEYGNTVDPDPKLSPTPTWKLHSQYHMFADYFESAEMNSAVKLMLS